jgi:flagellar protein FlaE
VSTPAGDASADAAADTAAKESASGSGESLDGAGSTGDSTAGAGKPYLADLPAGYAADLLVVEWLEFLVEEAGVRETARALDYYESIEWIEPAVADDLEASLGGFDGGGDGTLTIDHHARSLRYISQLNGGGADALAAGRLATGGGSDGIQR